MNEIQGFWTGMLWGLATLVAFGVVVAVTVFAYVIELGVAIARREEKPAFDVGRIAQRLGLRARTGRWTTKEERAIMARETGVPLDEDDGPS